MTKLNPQTKQQRQDLGAKPLNLSYFMATSSCATTLIAFQINKCISYTTPKKHNHSFPNTQKHKTLKPHTSLILGPKIFIHSLLNE